MAKRIFILTGGIGCGKSVVAQAFSDLGIGVVDADVIAHELTGSAGDAMPALRELLGAQAVNPDGSLNRPWVRQQAFLNPSIRQRLESVLHPMIQDRALTALSATPGPYAIYVVPLWLEKYGKAGQPGASQSPDAGQKAVPKILPEAVIVVDCPESLQITRVCERSGLAANEVRAIMATQVSRSERLAAADHVIENDESIESVVSKVKLLHKKLIAS